MRYFYTVQKVTLKLLLDTLLDKLQLRHRNEELREVIDGKEKEAQASLESSTK